MGTYPDHELPSRAEQIATTTTPAGAAGGDLVVVSGRRRRGGPVRRKPAFFEEDVETAAFLLLVVVVGRQPPRGGVAGVGHRGGAAEVHLVFGCAYVKQRSVRTCISLCSLGLYT